MSMIIKFFATTPKGMELLLVDELKQLGAASAAEKLAGVVFESTLEVAYKACLWSRLANRILYPLQTFFAATPEALYAGIKSIDWSEHFSEKNTIAVDFNTSQSQITHTQYGAQKVKDAIVDQFRERTDARPSVELNKPDIRINVYLYRDEATVSIDLSGESLHKRGYREGGGAAPLKENLAAAILLRAGWPAVAKAGGALLDPMCGSGTLLIEAALMAANIAPGLYRDHFGFLAWRQHQPVMWQQLVQQAMQAQSLENLPAIIGYDAEPRVINLAINNINSAELHGLIHVERRELVNCNVPDHTKPGLVVVNPPYGERLGDVAELQYLYAHLGALLKNKFVGWKASVFTGNPDLGKQMGLRAHKIYSLYNGALECKLLNFDVQAERFVQNDSSRENQARIDAAQRTELSAGAQMLLNRLQKNLKNIGKWASREGVGCYRLYDADLPEYAAAIDIYEQWVHVQEYEAPKTIDPVKAEQRLDEVLAVLPEVLNVPAKNIFLKVRRKQKGKAQYEKLSQLGQFYEVQESNAKFLVNFTDYLDTGLFLDHRNTREMIQTMSKGKTFLNLFAYTGAATVHAALGGASTTTTVDMSNVYLNWAKRNLALNGFSTSKHHFIQADCLAWLTAEKYKYDLIFLDPPSFSNSKRMDGTLDIQRDHVSLITLAAQRLTKQGTLLFSTNRRGFKLDSDALQQLAITDITFKSLPKDFKHSKIHQCWLITHK